MIESKGYQDIICIYRILNTSTGKSYIGSSTSLTGRIKRHSYYLKRGIHHSNKLQRSFIKYGEESFEVAVLESFTTITQADLIAVENKYIEKYDSIKNGYNMIPATEHINGFKQSEEAKANFKKARSKSLIAIDRFTGLIIKQFDALTDASAYFETSTSNISGVCKGRLNHIKGAVFVYKDVYDPTKDYRVLKHHMKDVPKTLERNTKSRLNNKKAHKVYKYDLNMNLINEYSSRSYCVQQEGFKKEFFRNKNTLDSTENINGYYYKTIKL